MKLRYPRDADREEKEEALRHIRVMQEEHLERLRTLHHQESQQVDQVCRMLKTDMKAIASQPEELLHQVSGWLGVYCQASVGFLLLASCCLLPVAPSVSPARL